jgi:hypothetical protein
MNKQLRDTCRITRDIRMREARERRQAALKRAADRWKGGEAAGGD